MELNALSPSRQAQGPAVAARATGEPSRRDPAIPAAPSRAGEPGVAAARADAPWHTARARATAPAVPVAPSRVELRIDELRLHGFPVSDRYRIAEAVERELTRLMETEGLPSGMAEGMALDRIDAGSIQLSGAAKPADIGARIARAIYGGLRR